jgi:hypothetical protein
MPPDISAANSQERVAAKLSLVPHGTDRLATGRGLADRDVDDVSPIPVADVEPLLGEGHPLAP